MLLLYTIGNYSPPFLNKNGKRKRKIGVRDVCEEYPEGYDGGVVFLTEQDAASFLNTAAFEIEMSGNSPDDFSVYAVIAYTDSVKWAFIRGMWVGKLQEDVPLYTLDEINDMLLCYKE